MEYQADGCGNNGIGVERRGRNTLIQLPSVQIHAVLAEPVIARGLVLGLLTQKDEKSSVFTVLRAVFSMTSKYSLVALTLTSV